MKNAQTIFIETRKEEEEGEIQSNPPKPALSRTKKALIVAGSLGAGCLGFFGLAATGTGISAIYYGIVGTGGEASLLAPILGGVAAITGTGAALGAGILLVSGITYYCVSRTESNIKSEFVENEKRSLLPVSEKTQQLVKELQAETKSPIKAKIITQSTAQKNEQVPTLSSYSGGFLNQSETQTKNQKVGEIPEEKLEFNKPSLRLGE
jgi:hypothetical protein